MKPLASRSHWTRRLALVLLAVVLLTLPVLVWAYSTGNLVHAIALANPASWNDQLFSGSGVSGGRASNPLRGSTNLQDADTTPPVITYTLTPKNADGGGGWYRSNVTLVWSVTDPESSVTKTGCVDQNITADQAETTYPCSATSAGGSSGPVNVKIKRDATPPNAPKAVATTSGGAYTENTWTALDVTINFTANGDNMSGVSMCFGFKVINYDNTSPVGGYCLDNAGNKSQYTSFTALVDKTAPTASPSLVPLPNANGWNNTDVAVTWNWTDGSGSGIDPNNCPAQTLSSTVSPGEGTLTVTGSCKDKVGRTGTSTKTVKVDKHAPYLGAGDATTGNGSAYTANTWTNNPPVSITWPCAENPAWPGPSGVLTATVTHSLSKDGADGVISAAPSECMDRAFNASGGADFRYVKIDTVKPVIGYTVTPAPNDNGWNNTDVTVNFTCTDALSGVKSNDLAAKTITTEGKGQSVTSSGTCVDNAGNVADPITVGGINIDKTTPKPPTGVISPQPNANGWNNSPVTVKFTSNGDNGSVQSGGVTCTADQNFSNDTAGTQVSGTCTDAAGNVSAPTTVTIKIDQTHPVITGSRDPGANSNGWNNTAVTVSFSCAEAGSVQSGLATNNVQGGTLSTEGQGLSVTNTGTCVDNAGNSAVPVTVGGINIDMTKPNPPTGSQNPSPNVAGWNNTPVTVSFGNNGDAGAVKSGVVWCLPAVTLDKDTPLAGTPVSGTCKDAAGNESAASAPVIVKIDMTAPYYGAPGGGATVLAAGASNGITATSKGLPYTAGTWTNASVTVSFQCSDDLSGPAATPVVKTITSEGANQTLTATRQECMDIAGNLGAADKSFGPINIDLTPPVITITPGLGCAEPTFTTMDALSGVATQSGKTIIKDGGYVFVATATDNAGNTSTQELPFTPYKGDGSLLLSPIHEKGDNLFKLGSVIPIKFRLLDCSGRPVLNADAHLKVVFLGSPTKPAGNVDIGSPGNADTGNQFRYDNTSGQYIFNWGTKGLWVGDYEISVSISGLSFKGTVIGLR